jgi:soluble lytic murein transglycosylase-like protein
VRRLPITLAIASACARPPAATAPPAATPTPAVEPAPPPAPPARAQAAPTPAPAPTLAAPTYEPLELSNAELARARSVQRIVAKAAQEHGVDANLINGIIWVETKFNARARNRSGARGLMQLMPVTSRAMAKRLRRAHKPTDPDFSIHAGTKLLSQLTEKYDGDEELALFGYARGIGSVAKWRTTPGQPLPQGVQAFITKVRRAQATFVELGFPDT